MQQENLDPYLIGTPRFTVYVWSIWKSTSVVSVFFGAYKNAEVQDVVQHVGLFQLALLGKSNQAVLICSKQASVTFKECSQPSLPPLQQTCTVKFNSCLCRRPMRKTTPCVQLSVVMYLLTKSLEFLSRVPVYNFSYLLRFTFIMMRSDVSGVVTLLYWETFFKTCQSLVL